MARIELDHLVKRYGDGFVAVDDATLDIADGELMILVGPSGCGKSTLLRMIVGLEDITSGELRIDGERMNETPPHERNLAMVFQNYALYPHLSVFENIAFPLRIKKLPERDVREKVSHAAEMLELTAQLPRRPSQLSGGQRRLGTTTVYVTHDQTEAMTLGDRVAVLRAGVLQQCATPHELYEQPANLFVGGFIGSPPMNIVPARIANGRLELPFVTAPLPPGIDASDAQGRVLVAGIRPEAFADAGRVDQEKRLTGATFTASVDLTEWLGNEQHAYVPYESPPALRAELEALSADLGGDTLRTQLIVSLDPAVRMRPGEPVRLWLESSKIHLFEPTSGSRIPRPPLRTGP